MWNWEYENHEKWNTVYTGCPKIKTFGVRSVVGGPRRVNNKYKE